MGLQFSHVCFKIFNIYNFDFQYIEKSKDLDFLPNICFLATTCQQHMLDGQSQALKMQGLWGPKPNDMGQKSLDLPFL